MNQGANLYFFILFQFIGLLVVLGGFFAYSRHQEISFFFGLWHKKRVFFIVETLMFALILLVLIKPVTANFKCFYNGNSLNRASKYDWFNGQCQIESGIGKNGKPTYVPFERIRGTSSDDPSPIDENE